MYDDDVLKPGVVIEGRFTLQRPLGRGAFGVVWLATDAVLLGREIAVKVLHPQASEGDAGERMAREAAVLTRLDHPNIARPVAFSAKPGLTYLAMEYVDGEPLNEHMAARNGVPHALNEVARIFDELCSAVAYAHARSVIHRDLKPQNVMIQQRGSQLFVKVLDFGVAKILEGNSTDGTTQGRTIGSLFYLSPEQARGDPTTTASDVFALGSMLFELLTLRRAWAHDRQGAALAAFTVPVMADGVNSLVNVVDRIMRGPRPRPTQYRAELPRALDRIIAQAVAIDPQERQATVESLRDEVLTALGGRRADREAEELTAVRPVDVGHAPEEELSTVAPRRERLASLDSGAVLVPTRQVPGGVSAHLVREVPANLGREVPAYFDQKTSAVNASATDEVAVPTMVKTVVAERGLVPVVMHEPTVVRTPTGVLMPVMTTDPRVMGVVTSPPQRWPLIAGAILGSAALVIVTYAITRASYETPARAPVQPVLAEPVRAPALVAVQAEPEPAETAPPAITPAASPAPTPSTPTPSTPRPTASPRRTAAPTASAAPAAPRSELAGLLERARQAPGDAARLAALSAAITRAAQKVPDTAARTQIRRMASSSAMVGNFEGLEQAYRDLSRALERAGEPMP